MTFFFSFSLFLLFLFFSSSSPSWFLLLLLHSYCSVFFLFILRPDLSLPPSSFLLFSFFSLLSSSLRLTILLLRSLFLPSFTCWPLLSSFSSAGHASSLLLPLFSSSSVGAPSLSFLSSPFLLLGRALLQRLSLLPLFSRLF
ncbi:hypothetical protein ACOSQ2_017318 [Xanthoceras sorbifolium]